MVRYRVGGPPDPVAEVYRAGIRGGNVVAPCKLPLPILITSAFRVLAFYVLKAFLLGDR